MQDFPLKGQTLSGWTIVFDLDGTLVETAPDLLAALNHVLGDEGLGPIQLADIRTMIGHGAKAMIRAGLSQHGRPDPLDAEIDRLWRTFLDYYQANIAVHSRPFAGLVPLLAELRAAGAILAVCTNKTQALSERLLDALDLSKDFSAIVGADAVPEKKPCGDHILRAISAAGGSQDKAIMVGDSRTDERAALDAGLPFIFVPFGYESASPEEITADAVVESYSGFLDALSPLIS